MGLGRRSSSSRSPSASWDLGSRAFHHDESIHGWFSLRPRAEGRLQVRPRLPRPGAVLHGRLDVPPPRRLGLHARASRRRSGASASWRWRCSCARASGAGAAFASGVLLALSPNLLYFTRFCREDVWSLLGTFGLFLWLDRWWRTRRVADLGLAAVWGAVAFASKENFYVLGALMVPSVLAAVWEPGKGFPAFAKIRSLLDVLETHGAAILGALFLFFTLSEVAYTFFLVHPESGNPAFVAISYWWGQHKVERVGGPKTYYLPRILQYEFAIVLPALALDRPAVAALRSPPSGSSRRSRVSSVVMYAYLGEKTPWLIVHQILPFVPLAGAAWAALCASRARAAAVGGPGRPRDRPVDALALLLEPAPLARHPRAESVVFTQTSPELMPVVDGRRWRSPPTGADPAAAVVGRGGLAALLVLPAGCRSLGDAERGRPAAVRHRRRHEGRGGAAAPRAATTSRRQIPLRAWWIPEISLSPLRPTPAGAPHLPLHAPPVEPRSGVRRTSSS